jgi:hypothetical protein
MKPTRRDVANAKQLTLRLGRVKAAQTPAAALWSVCKWLVTDARRAGRIADTIRAVYGLIFLLRNGEPIPPQLLTAADELHADERHATALLAKLETIRGRDA